MPIYEYFCPQCNEIFELRLSFSETNCTPICPKCYSSVERLISSFSCKTGGNIQAADKPFRAISAAKKSADKESEAPAQRQSVLITPPPGRIELLSQGKGSTRTKRKKK